MNADIIGGIVLCVLSLAWIVFAAYAFNCTEPIIERKVDDE